MKQRVKSTQAKDPKRQRHSRQSIDELTDLVIRRVGRRIQRLREARGLSQEAFAVPENDGELDGENNHR